jgi:hypothetical protein
MGDLVSPDGDIVERGLSWALRYSCADRPGAERRLSRWLSTRRGLLGSRSMRRCVNATAGAGSITLPEDYLSLAATADAKLRGPGLCPPGWVDRMSLLRRVNEMKTRANRQGTRGCSSTPFSVKLRSPQRDYSYRAITPLAIIKCVESREYQVVSYRAASVARKYNCVGYTD